MAHFLKLQSISLLLALTILITIQLLANSGRLSLIMGDASMLIIAIISLASLVLFARIIVKRLKHLAPSPFNLFLYVLWLPYLALFTYGWTRVVPAPNEAAWPGPVVGLFIIGITFTFPIYIGLLHMFARKKGATHTP